MRQHNRIMILLAAAVAAAASQGHAQTKRETFEEFRQRIKSDYGQFRQTLLDNYADFLAGEWHEYQSLNGTRSSEVPKPKKAPVAPAGNAKPQKPEKPEKPAPAPAPTPIPVPTPTPEPEPVASEPAKAPASDREADRFLFYNLPVQVAHADYDIAPKLYSNADYAAQWRELDKQGVAEAVVPGLEALASQAGLNGYLKFRLAEAYADGKFGSRDATSRTSLVHYILAHMGYDARLATSADGTPMLLLPLDRLVHARTFLMMEGKKFYIFTPKGTDQKRLANQPISTCRIPAEINRNAEVDLLLGPLSIPRKDKAFDIAHGRVHLTGEVNEYLMPLLYDYPQMKVGEYGKCNPDPELRRKVAQQLKEQLSGSTGDEASGALLEFMHRAFSYATDEEQHGFEKPYFIEETLYYPKNDCEDRAIFYTYYLWNALGRESQLITFPGHAAAAITLDTPVGGTSYEEGGKRWWISDPTYIGSHTGQVMPAYSNASPTVEYTYGE